MIAKKVLNDKVHILNVKEQELLYLFLKIFFLLLQTELQVFYKEDLKVTKVL